VHWLVHIFIALVVAGLGLFAGGFVGDRCVHWYRVSSFEGGSGFFVIGLALVGGFVGGLVGLITAAVRGARTAPEHFQSCGVAAGILAGLTLLTLALCRVFADVAPELDGRPLVLEVEVRLPVGATPATNGPSTVTLSALRDHTVVRSREGLLHPENARLDQGRWIVPGDVPLFTESRTRSIDFALADTPLTGFVLPLPARPGREFLEWSKWGPRPPAGEPPWPDTKPSYRFRIQKVPEPPPPMTAEEFQAEQEAKLTANFQAIPADAPLTNWFTFTAYGMREDLRSNAVSRIVAKPGYLAELTGLMVSDDARVAEAALRVVELLPPAGPDLNASVTAAGQDLIQRIRKVNATTPEQDPGYHGFADISIRFTGWVTAVQTLREKAGGDFIPELKAILELSRARPDSIAMGSDVRRVASYYLKEWAGIEPLPGDPPPR
jgi:hypothetical protein